MPAAFRPACCGCHRPCRVRAVPHVPRASRVPGLPFSLATLGAWASWTLPLHPSGLCSVVIFSGGLGSSLSHRRSKPPAFMSSRTREGDTSLSRSPRVCGTPRWGSAHKLPAAPAPARPALGALSQTARLVLTGFLPRPFPLGVGDTQRERVPSLMSSVRPSS